MNVMRENKESLMAVLEAFVYDPLITWRLSQTQEQQHRGRGTYLSAFSLFPPSSGLCANIPLG